VFCGCLFLVLIIIPGGSSFLFFFDFFSPFFFCPAVPLWCAIQKGNGGVWKAQAWQPVLYGRDVMLDDSMWEGRGEHAAEEGGGFRRRGRQVPEPWFLGPFLKEEKESQRQTKQAHGQIWATI
jgi:hypothetical protein